METFIVSRTHSLKEAVETFFLAGRVEGKKLTKAMHTWIEMRGYKAYEEALFVTRNGERLKKRNIERVIERMARRAGISGVRRQIQMENPLISLRKRLHLNRMQFCIMHSVPGSCSTHLWKGNG